ncbi:hypothetical protein ACHAWF_012213 [Thalassiosira exigua]
MVSAAPKELILDTGGRAHDGSLCPDEYLARMKTWELPSAPPPPPPRQNDGRLAEDAELVSSNIDGGSGPVRGPSSSSSCERDVRKSRGRGRGGERKRGRRATGKRGTPGRAAERRMRRSRKCGPREPRRPKRSLVSPAGSARREDMRSANPRFRSRFRGPVAFGACDAGEVRGAWLRSDGVGDVGRTAVRPVGGSGRGPRELHRTSVSPLDRGRRVHFSATKSFRCDLWPSLYGWRLRCRSKFHVVETVFAITAFVLMWLGTMRCDFVKFVSTSGASGPVTLRFGIWYYQFWSFVASADGIFRFESCHGYPDSVQLDDAWRAARSFSVITVILALIMFVTAAIMACVHDPHKSTKSWMAPMYMLTALCEGLMLLLLQSNVCKNNSLVRILPVITFPDTCSLSTGANLCISAMVFWAAAGVCSFMGSKARKEERAEMLEADLREPLASV